VAFAPRYNPALVWAAPPEPRGAKRFLQRMHPRSWRFAHHLSADLVRQIEYLPWSGRVEVFDTYFLRQAETILQPKGLTALVGGQLPAVEPIEQHQLETRRARFAEWSRMLMTAVLLDLDERAEVMTAQQGLTYLLTLDMDDVAVIRSAGRFTLNVGTRQQISGRIVVNEREIQVYDGETTTTVSRSRLLAAVAETKRERDLWSAKIAFGANFRSGNTDQVEYNSKINVQRQSAWSRFQLDYLGSLSRTNDVKTSDNLRLTSTLDIFATHRWFVRPLGGEYFRDTFQNIRHRFTGYGGVGYELAETPRFDWNVFAGPGFLHTVYEDPTEDGQADAFAGIFSSRFEYDLNHFQDLNGTYQATITNKESGGYIHNLLLSLENEIIDNFDIDITFVWSRISEPAETSDGETPDPDDFQLLFSLGYEL